jgi:hypothetical protein
MAKCGCCHVNEGRVREYETRRVPSWQQPEPMKRVPAGDPLCDACNDGQHPYYDERGIQTCPHGVVRPK